VGVVQANIVGWANGERLRSVDIVAEHWDMTEALTRQGCQLILWPEGAFPGNLASYPHWVARFAQWSRDHRVSLIIGSSGSLQESGAYVNEAWWFTGDLPQPTVYRKNRLLAFGEVLPRGFGWLRHLVPWIGDFQAGNEMVLFDSPWGRIWPMICFESLFWDWPLPQGPDWIVNLTNDAWFGPTKASAQHFQHIALRAVEWGVPLLRGANSGISGWVTPQGQWRDCSPVYQKGALVWEVPLGLARPQQAPWTFPLVLRLLIWMGPLVVWFTARHLNGANRERDAS
jgi:apolipoprotein N-acyltransferase